MGTLRFLDNFLPGFSDNINNGPNIAAFLQFRIRGFKAFIRAENLNTAEVTPDGGFGCDQ